MIPGLPEKQNAVEIASEIEQTASRYFSSVTVINASVGPSVWILVGGENGAGKSALMRILAGVVQPDAGTIEVKGKSAVLTSPRRAHDFWHCDGLSGHPPCR